MTVEALWAVRFGHAGGEMGDMNAGVVVLETGRVLGGDSWFAYVGSYEVTASNISGEIHVTRHQQNPDTIDAWNTGDDEFDITFSVSPNAEHTVAVGTMVRAGLPPIGLRLTRVAELPGN